MDEWRDFYKDSKQEVINFWQALLIELIKINPDLIDVDIRKSLFRINRDMRFVRSWWPYKPRFAIYIAMWWRKSAYAWLYIHIQPWGKSLIAWWCYELDYKNLQLVRKQITLSDQELSVITNNKKFKAIFWQIQGKTRKILPRWYTTDTPWSQRLMQDSRYVYKSYTDEQVTSLEFLSQIVSDYKALKPFNNYFNEVIDRKAPFEQIKWYE